MSSKRGFTLVELLAVIVILAVILVIAVPRVMSIIEDVRISTLESTAKLVALSAEKKKIENEIVGNNEILICENVVKINDIDYESCYIEFIDNKAVVTIIGSGTFKGMNACEATKNNANITERCLNKKVEVTLELNDGVATDITGIYKEGTIIDLEEPIKENSTFIEYKIVSGNSVISNNKLTVGSTNTIIHAMYESWPTLEMDLDGGRDNTDYKEKYKSGSIIELEVPTKDKHTFIGWQIIEGNSILSGNTLTMGSIDTIVKALWEINIYKLNVDLDDGNTSQRFNDEYIEGTIIELVTPAKTGYTFNGWNVTGNGASVNDNILTIGKEDTSIKTLWVPNIYKVTYNPGDGTVSTTYENVTYNDFYGEMPIPVKERYMFIGWYNSDNKEVISTDKVEILKDIELTAKYIKNEFIYTGNYETFIVPKDGNYKIELWGAQGGGANGGYGGYTSGDIELNENDILYIYVGEHQERGDFDIVFNGGGAALAEESNETNINRYTTGGGATDIRISSGIWNEFSSLKSRIMIAGGGGGTNDTSKIKGGAGGGIIGYDGALSYTDTTYIMTTAKGGSQISGGEGGTSTYGSSTFDGNGTQGGFGFGGNSITMYKSGGGSGYYGGGSSSVTRSSAGSGGGGSSFISGHAGCNAIKEESTEENIVHTGQSIHYSNYKFINTIMIDGNGYNWTNIKGNYTGMPSYDGKSVITGNIGHGYAKITYIR